MGVQVAQVYEKLEQGADKDFVFGSAYSCTEGYTPLMVAAHRSRLECAKALLRSGANPNFCNKAGVTRSGLGSPDGSPLAGPLGRSEPAAPRIPQATLPYSGPSMGGWT
jgi:hypothetical protein